MWRLMTPHLRRLIRKHVSSLWEAFGAFGDRCWGLHLWHFKWLPVKLERAIIVTCQGPWICIARRTGSRKYQ